MNIVDLIIKKRDGGKLTKEEIDFFIDGVTHETIADYQISAMLMAMFFNPLDTEETAMLTQAMTNSGETYDLSEIKGIKVDKHSTGGVADTTTLILAPLVASTGVPVVKMSGRGLGFSGGTLDKLESIPGFSVSVSKKDAIKFVNQSNIVIMGQSENLTPADKKLYAMRDVTGTVDSMPLIVGSIMSKKIAAGADAIVLDVKCGSGAFMKDYQSAKELATQMCEIGTAVNRRVTAVISSMEQPLGQNIGNALEVIEAIEILKGNIQGDLLEVSLTLGSYMLINANRVTTVDEGRTLLSENIKNGKGLEKFRELIIQQNGNPNVCDDYSLFDQCSDSIDLKAEKSGFIEKIDTALVGRASVETGAGRKEKSDTIDYGAGIIMKVRIGDYVNVGDIIATIFTSSNEKCQTSLFCLNQAIHIGENKPETPQLILDII